LDGGAADAMTTIAKIHEIHEHNLAAVRAHQHSVNLAHYLSQAPLSELIDLVGALSAELVTVRGYSVAEPLGLVSARLEYYMGDTTR
jgi:hypothetical protein